MHATWGSAGVFGRQYWYRWGNISCAKSYCLIWRAETSLGGGGGVYFMQLAGWFGEQMAVGHGVIIYDYACLNGGGYGRSDWLVFRGEPSAYPLCLDGTDGCDGIGEWATDGKVGANFLRGLLLILIPAHQTTLIPFIPHHFL